MLKYLLFLFLAFQVLLGVVSAQDVITKFTPYNSTSSIEVKEGEVCEILNLNGRVYVSTNSIYSSYDSGTLGSKGSSGAEPNSLGQNFPIAGPVWIHLDTSVVISYRIRPNTSSSTTTPANAVVIPTDATGSVQIILESSTDLVTWTQANPGTYGASTTKRFFRIRAVNQ